MKIQLKAFLDNLDREFSESSIEDRKITLGDSIEDLQIQEYFGNKKWNEITLDWLNNYVGDPSVCLLFMTPEAAKYFLPAYLKIALEDYDKSNAIPDSIVHLLYEVALNADPNLAQILKDLTVGQKKVIAEFLVLMSKHYWSSHAIDSPKQALNLYWEKCL